ncbi:MAG: DUF3037 domain-containing protein [Acidobacteria bacterium]|nr:DUF3037 domain-containing protein [Acidobacteriota bacterium]
MPAFCAPPTSATCWRVLHRRVRGWRRRAVSAEWTYDYALIRVVPRVERGEQINVGVILSCVDADFLQCRIDLDETRLRALDPGIDMDGIRDALAIVPVVCAGGAAAGPIGQLPPRGRFRWLVSPRSTIIQMSPVHTGRTSDPAGTLDRLLETMVRTKVLGPKS